METWQIVWLVGIPVAFAIACVLARAANVVPYSPERDDYIAFGFVAVSLAVIWPVTVSLVLVALFLLLSGRLLLGR